jgi:hypothetical protein
VLAPNPGQEQGFPRLAPAALGGRALLARGWPRSQREDRAVAMATAFTSLSLSSVCRRSGAPLFPLRGDGTCAQVPSARFTVQKPCSEAQSAPGVTSDHPRSPLFGEYLAPPGMRAHGNGTSWEIRCGSRRSPTPGGDRGHASSPPWTWFRCTARGALSSLLFGSTVRCGSRISCRSCVGRGVKKQNGSVSPPSFARGIRLLSGRRLPARARDGQRGTRASDARTGSKSVTPPGSPTAPA